jgi:hypothetical protein
MSFPADSSASHDDNQFDTWDKKLVRGSGKGFSKRISQARIGGNSLTCMLRAESREGQVNPKNTACESWLMAYLPGGSQVWRATVRFIS